ncbi:putative MFS transporter [Microdochium trichocladiopsis]|uniref:MFS transporter n=1 Tax=Microdochium trichocladiopsis TaxID=1682393 RepID=A0A9P9BLL9_9PEZI|nr:putative MFS transporter [Microdochium trichocladiopsis]KAH7024535.1 putative MFS transporter [Microdochium trichocladiopsis]
MSKHSDSEAPTIASDVEKTHTYIGSGTEQDPFVVEFQKDDPSNPMNWSQSRKWFITAVVAMSVFVVTFASSAPSSSFQGLIRDLDVSRIEFTLIISLFVLGFAIGPAFWGPVSELYGRRIQWIVAHIGMIAFFGGSAGSKNIATLSVLRLLAGIFGASPLVNSGGAIADMFLPAQRGLAMTLYGVAPFVGTTLGPILGGLISANAGWRWVYGVCCIAIGVNGVFGAIFVPETYGPVLLARKATHLATQDGQHYISVLEKGQAKKTPSEVFQKALVRPWVFLFLEPIVLVACIYVAIIFGTVYLFMGAMPIVFSQGRGWSEATSGLSFLGMLVGIIAGLAYVVFDNNTRYMRLSVAKTATPESRLPPAIIGAVALPVGMFGFAWTNFPSIHWAVCIVLSAPFGLGCVLVMLPITNYLMDSYTVYAASVLAAAAILRSILGAVFPLFTPAMYQNLGIHWATSIPAFLTLACMPFPFIMHKYGGTLRMKCKYAAEAAEVMRTMQRQQAAAVVPAASEVRPGTSSD